MNVTSVRPAVSLETPNLSEKVGCAGRLMSIDSAISAVIDASVRIQRVEPIAIGRRGLGISAIIAGATMTEEVATPIPHPRNAPFSRAPGDAASVRHYISRP